MDHILVVDDEPEIVQLLSRFLRRQGYEVTTAVDGEAAVACLEASPCALVVTDITMPRMDGLEVLKRAKDRDPDIEVIILTGAGVLAHAITALRTGAYDFLLKPLDRIEALGEVVHRALEHRRLLQENRRLIAALQQANRSLEEKVAVRTADLEEANRRLAEALRVKSEFLDNMSHELRTPLNTILGFTELLRDQSYGPLTEKQARFLGNIHRGGEHLLALVSDLLDLSKVESWRLKLQPEVVNLSELLEAIKSDFQPQAGNKSLTLEVRVEAPPCRCTVDPVRLTQILHNLLSNAVKFTPEGGTITVTARRVTEDQGPMTGDRGPATGAGTRPPSPVLCLELRVTDTGIGIKAEDLPRLFQPLTQLDPSRTKRYPGTGLGLALTKQLVDLHGGRIRATSDGEGQGSTFTVVLPLGGPPGVAE